MRLTRLIKRSITERMVEHYYPVATIQTDKKALGDFARNSAKTSIPEDVLKTFKKYPGYFKKGNEVRFSSKGGDFFRDGSVHVFFPDGHLPCDSSYFAVPYNLEVSKLSEKIEKYAELRKELSVKIGRVLESCTTTKQLAEALPESIPFVPEESSAGLPVPIEAYESLRKELKILSNTAGKTAKETI